MILAMPVCCALGEPSYCTCKVNGSGAAVHAALIDCSMVQCHMQMSAVRVANVV